jgi:methylated-DNA-[protein]-cysteine S-methyltransferase
LVIGFGFDSTASPRTMQTLMRRHRFPTALGDCALAWDETGLLGCTLPGGDLPAATPESPPPWLTALAARVQHHLAGQLQTFADAPYAFATVTAFARSVYELTLSIPPGATRSYGELAVELSLPPGGARAVAAALGANPWPLLVPCHRIVGADGRMTGFSGPGGIRTKTRLLALEGAQLLSE